MKTIQVLMNVAMLENSGMGSDDIDQLKDPEYLHCTLDISDMHLVKALQHFIYLTNTSYHYYETI
jgi:hypothetical protein